jgi:hypothetical protein
MKSLKNLRSLVVVFTLLLSCISQWAIADTSNETNPSIDELFKEYYRPIGKIPEANLPDPEVKILYDETKPFQFLVKVIDKKTGRKLNGLVKIVITGELVKCYSNTSGLLPVEVILPESPYIMSLNDLPTDQTLSIFKLSNMFIDSLEQSKKVPYRSYTELKLNHHLIARHLISEDEEVSGTITAMVRINFQVSEGRFEEIGASASRNINIDYIAKIQEIKYNRTPHKDRYVQVFKPSVELPPGKQAKLIMLRETAYKGMKLKPNYIVEINSDVEKVEVKWLGEKFFGRFRPTGNIGDIWASIIIQPTSIDQMGLYNTDFFFGAAKGSSASTGVAAIITAGITGSAGGGLPGAIIGIVASVIGTVSGVFDPPYIFVIIDSFVVIDSKEVVTIYVFEGSAKIFDNDLKRLATVSEGQMITRDKTGVIDGPKALDTSDLKPEIVQEANYTLAALGKPVFAPSTPGDTGAPGGAFPSTEVKPFLPPNQQKSATPPSEPGISAAPIAKVPPDKIQTLESPTKPKPYEGQLPTPPFPQREVVQQYDNGTINWSKGTITAVGIGAPPPNAVNMAQARAMARRAAIVVARRNLLELVQGVQIDSMTLVKEAVVQSDIIRTSIQGVVRNAQIVDTDYMSDGSVEVKVAMNISGQLANTILPQHSPAVPWATGPSVATVTPETPKPSSDIITGLVVDARGLGTRPAMSPRIVDETGKEIYGSAMVNRQYAVQQGMTGYSRDLGAAQSNSRVTANPLTVKGLRSIGPGKTDIVISNSDASRMLSAAENLLFMQKCRVMIVVD